MNVLVMNPGGNSLKAEVVFCAPGQANASNGKKLAALTIEGIGKEPCLSILNGKAITHTETVQAKDYGEAATTILDWLKDKQQIAVDDIHCAGVRVVHGGTLFTGATRVTPQVEKEISEFERLSPLHNKNSLALLEPLRHRLPKAPLYAVFDTAFHRTIPEVASLYAIPRELAEKHGIRRFGFHGTSHRYMLERAANLLGKAPQDLSVVTMHLESGCSATAIARGKSVDNTMGFTPLEGLMMGTRSGDVDPSLVEFLVREGQMDLAEVMTLLNKKSGLLGISEQSLDTRVLMKQYGRDARVTLAIDMFAYRLVKAVGALVAVVGDAEAIVFGGGIGENNAVVRARVCEALQCWGLQINVQTNKRLVDGEGFISTESSRLKALVVVTEEGMQIAHECSQALSS